MKKKPIIIVFLIVICLALFYLGYIFGWMTFINNKDTPTAFISHVRATKKVYTNDSINVLKNLQYFLKTHQQSFYSNEYYHATQLSIDTILFSPDFNKLVVFVIAKNPTARQLAPDDRYEWYYVGYCYLGTIQRDSIDLTFVHPGVRSYFKEKVISGLRTNYFRLFATIKDINGNYRYKYNLDDLRFWNCPIWREIKDDEIKAKAFQEEKKNHPENIYEPKPPHYDN